MAGENQRSLFAAHPEMNFDLTPLFLTFRLAAVTTIVLAVIGIPLAYWLAFGSRQWKTLVEPLVSMPLILPPTALGFYILLLFSPHAPIGNFLERVLHLRVVFTFPGLVIGSVLFSLPFMVNPIKAGFQDFPQMLCDAADTLGKSKSEILFKVLLPNIKPSLLTGMVMTFAHTIGEFGVVLMIGGNIPSETRVASIAIYSEMEALNYPQAHFYSAVLFCLCFLILFALNGLNRKEKKVWG